MENQRNGIWDIIRALAAILVMFHHYTTNYDIYYGHKELWPLRSDYGGMIGVCMFFILTGYFLIPSLEHSSGIFQYAKKRFVRLYPSYWACLIITFIVVFFFPLEGRTFGLKEFIVNLTMLQSYLGVENIDGAYWTLGVQIYVYVSFSVLYFIFGGRNIMRFIYFLIGWLCVNTVMMIFDIDNIIISLLLQIQYIQLFIQGVILYVILKKKNRSPYLFVVLILSIIYSYWSIIPEYSVINAIDVVIVLLIGLKKVSYMKTNFFTYLGTISYTIYLLHQNIGYVIIMKMESIGLTNELYVLVPMGVIVILASLIYKYIEKPVTLNMK